YERAICGERPDASALKIAGRLQREMLGKSLLRGARSPVQKIRQPALGRKSILSANAHVITIAERLDLEPDRWPPSGELGDVFDETINFLARAFDAPARLEDVFVAGHRRKDTERRVDG